MMRAIKLLVACVAVLTAAPVLANLIVNGSFEAPTVPTGSFINYPGGSTAITGWTVVGVDSAIVSTTFTQSGITFEAENGTQWIDLAGVTSNSMTSGVAQNISTTIGQIYQISFYVGSSTDNRIFFPATVDLSIDGGARVHHTNPNAPTNMLDWQRFTVNFTATNGTTNLTFFNGDASNNFETPLDNVSVNDINFLPGDINRDGHVNVADIAAMTSALADLSAYQSTHGPGGGALSDPQLVQIGDLTGDGKFTNADLQALINLLANGDGTGGLTAVPEPASWALLVFGGFVSMILVDRCRSTVRRRWVAGESLRGAFSALIYCAPPYVHGTRANGSNNVYGVEMCDDEHRDLAKLLKQCQAKIVLSGYPSRLYDRLYSGWRRINFDIANHAAGGKTKARETECLWMNF